MAYNALDSNLRIYNRGYLTLDTACSFLEQEIDTANVVRYVEDEGGDLVALVYAGASWFPSKIKQEIVVNNGRLAEGVKDV